MTDEEADGSGSGVSATRRCRKKPVSGNVEQVQGCELAPHVPDVDERVADHTFQDPACKPSRWRWNNRAWPG